MKMQAKVFDKLATHIAEMDGAERAALAELGISAASQKLQGDFRALQREVIRTGATPFGAPLTQREIDEEGAAYENQHGKKARFLPQSQFTLKGVAMTVATLGFNIAANAFIENGYAAADNAAGARAVKETERSLMQKLQRFL